MCLDVLINICVNIKIEKQVCLETQEIFAAELTSLSTGSAFGTAPEKALLQTQKRSPRSGIFTVWRYLTFSFKTITMDST